MCFSRTTRSAFAVFIFVAVTLICDRARADDEPAPLYQADDTVVMTDGHEIKGHVVFEAARTFLRMWLDDGKVVTIPWTEIDRVILSPAKPNLPPVTILPPSPSSPEKSDDDIPINDGANDTVHVIFEADSKSTELEQRSLNNSREWITVCKGRCSEDLLLHGDYRIGGGGARSSAVFHLRGQPNDTVVVTPQTHSKGLFALGITMTSLGGILLLASADALAQCSSENSCGPAGPIVAFVLGSGIATVGGIAMIAASPSSKVSQHTTSMGFAARNSSEPATLAAALPSRLDSPFHSLTPQFAPPARTSSLFTIHF